MWTSDDSFINNFFKSKPKDPKCVIMGEIGSGKTTFVNKVCKTNLET